MTILFIAYFTMFHAASVATYCKSFLKSFSFLYNSRWLLGDLFAIMWKCVVFDIGHRSLLIAARRSTVCMYACMLYAISVTEA